jgi:hypothetical protein
LHSYTGHAAKISSGSWRARDKQGWGSPARACVPRHVTDPRAQFLLAAIHATLSQTSNRILALRGAGHSTVLQVFSDLHDDHMRRLGTYAARAKVTELDDGPMLRTLLEDARGHDRSIAQYAPDTLRTDLPSGFRVLIEAAVQAVRGDGIQHLVHPAHGDYAAHAYASRLPLIIIQVPAADPTNALLSPILAHEVGHAHLEDRLRSMEGFRDEAEAELDALRRSIGPAASDIDAAHRRVDAWVEELLCDTMATLVTGPSMLFAVHAHASELPWDTGNAHPPAHFRIGIVLATLERLGWTDHLDVIAPGVREYSEAYAALPRPTDPTWLAYALAATEALLPAVIAHAESVGFPALRPETALERATEVAKYFDLALMPTELPWSAQVEWEFLLGAWMSGLNGRKEVTATNAMPAVARDAQLNALLLKAIELARIKHEWDAL